MSLLAHLNLTKISGAMVTLTLEILVNPSAMSFFRDVKN